MIEMVFQDGVNVLLRRPMTSRTETQRERVLRWLGAGHSITSYQAYEDFGITQLGAIIFYLKADGYAIDTEWVERNGTRFKKYFLGGVMRKEA